MSESAPAAIPTDFYTDAGWIKSCGMSSHPGGGDEVVIDGKMYVVEKKTFDFDTGGMAVLVRIYVVKR
jgi:hypothetical protein